MISLKNYLLPITIGALVIFGAVTFYLANRPDTAGNGTAQQHQVADAAVHPEHGHLHGLQAVFYKSPTCDCCDIYAEGLQALGVQVAVVADAQRMYEVKQHYRIPPAGASCHTFTLGEYVIEGHVPYEALEKLLAERPAIDGIVLGGMPIGTPGMPGEQTAPFYVKALKGGNLTPFMIL